MTSGHTGRIGGAGAAMLGCSLLIAGLATGCSSAEKAGHADASTVPDRPHDPWVFRCVLDERPRCVVVALRDGLWVAYDGTTGGIARVMSRPVNFEGAVYTGGHGPQPTTQPPNYETHEPDATGWTLRDPQGQELAVELHGYRSDGERSVTLRWAIAHADAATAADFVIEERPEAWPGAPRAWSRHISIRGLPKGWTATQRFGPDTKGRVIRLAEMDGRASLGGTIEFKRDTAYTLLTTYAPLPEPETEPDVGTSDATPAESGASKGTGD